jgi:hypothetical protein
MKTSNITEQDALTIYYDLYIGKSAGITACAAKFDTSVSTLRDHWIRNHLRLRTKEESYEARQSANTGRPWRWSTPDPNAEAIRPPLPDAAQHSVGTSRPVPIGNGRTVKPHPNPSTPSQVGELAALIRKLQALDIPVEISVEINIDIKGIAP